MNDEPSTYTIAREVLTRAAYARDAAPADRARFEAHADEYAKKWAVRLAEGVFFVDDMRARAVASNQALREELKETTAALTARAEEAEATRWTNAVELQARRFEVAKLRHALTKATDELAVHQRRGTPCGAHPNLDDPMCRECYDDLAVRERLRELEAKMSAMLDIATAPAP